MSAKSMIEPVKSRLVIRTTTVGVLLIMSIRFTFVVEAKEYRKLYLANVVVLIIITLILEINGLEF